MGNSEPAAKNIKLVKNPSSNKYKCLEAIGYGSISRILLAIESKTDNKFAIKQTQKARVIWKQLVKQVLNELSILKQLKHQFIVNIFSAFQDRERLYLVMEYCPKGDLRQQYINGLVLDQDQLRFLAACLILALQEIHNNGIIHHDLKPQNIVFTKNNYPKVTDFGVATYWRPQNSQDSFGTIGYMAPEVILRQNHGVSVDYFSLGVILFQAIRGYRPYRGRTRREMKDQMISVQVQLRAKQARNFSTQCLQFINSLIQRKSANRLGNNGPHQLKKHSWLSSVSWQQIRHQSLSSPLVRLQAVKVRNSKQQQVPEQYRTLNLKMNQLFDQYKLSRA